METTPWLWAVAIASGGLWFALNREKKLSKTTFGRISNFALYAVFGTALLYAPWGSWGTLVEGLGGLVGKVLSQTSVGKGLSTVLLLVAMAITAVDLAGRKKDKFARVGIVLMAILAASADGWLCHTVEKGFLGVNTATVALVQGLSH